MSKMLDRWLWLFIDASHATEHCQTLPAYDDLFYFIVILYLALIPQHINLVKLTTCFVLMIKHL